MILRVSQFITTCVRHAVPLGGIFAQQWHPATALAVYWLESVLLVLAVALLCALMYRRTSERAVTESRLAGDIEEARRLGIARGELHNAKIAPRDVLGFYFASLLVFAGFLGGVTIMLIENGHIAPPRWDELSDAAMAITLVVALSVTIDLFRFDSLTVAGLRSRVDACLARWVLFWLVGFVGSILMAVSEEPTIIFGFFAVLKVIFESWARIGSVLGWRSLQHRGVVMS